MGGSGSGTGKKAEGPARTNILDQFAIDLRTMTAFGPTAIYTAQSLPAVTVQLLAFDQTYIDFDPTGQRVATTYPVAHAMTENFTAARINETLKIGAVTYRITGIEPDGTGVTVLKLTR